MLNITTNQYMKTFLLDTGDPVVVTPHDVQFMPTDCFILPAGSKADRASVIIMATRPDCPTRIFVQMSKETMKDMLQALEGLP